MDLNSFMEKFAAEINGQYSEYDSSKSVIIVPTENERFQTVYGTIKESDKYNGRSGIEFNTKVCPMDDSIDLKSLLEQNGKFCHAKFIIEDDFIKVEGSAFVDTATEDQLKEIIQEVATVADESEKRITGKDIY